MGKIYGMGIYGLMQRFLKKKNIYVFIYTLENRKKWGKLGKYF